MGLITKEIDVCIVSNNYKHYEDLGYCDVMDRMNQWRSRLFW